MKKLYCSLVLGGIFSGIYSDMCAITLEEALVAAFRNNKSWFASKTEQASAQATYTQSQLAFLPSVSASIGTSRQRQDKNMQDNRTGAVIRPNIESTDTDMSINVKQNLFSGFSTVNTMKAAEYSNSAAFHRLKGEEQSLVLNVVSSYTEIWFYRRKLEALRKMVANLKNTLQAQQSSLEAGMSTPTDVAEAESKYQGAIYSMIDAETELMSAESEFERLTGLKADNDMDLPDFRFELPKSVENLIDRALNSNSAINVAKLQERAALKRLDAVKGGLVPSCDAGLSAGKSLSKGRIAGSRSIDQDPRTYSASISVTIPIFTNNNGNNTYSQIELANQEALKARFNAEDTVLKVKKECVVYWNKHKSAVAMIEASRSAVKSAELSSEGNIEESALGMKSNTDVWAKENNLLESRVNLAKSQKEKIVAAVTLLYLTGDLSKSLIIESIKKSFVNRKNIDTTNAVKAVESKHKTENKNKNDTKNRSKKS